MSSTRRRGASPVVERIFGDPGRIAPSVTKAWRDDFIVELRLLSVPGDRIGDALVTVEAHVRETGEAAPEAFGQAKAYAREIAEATGAAGTGWVISTATVVSSLLGLLGMLVSVRAFGSWLEGEPAGVTTGELVGLAVLLLLACALFVTPTLRLIVEHRWLALPVPALLVGGFVALFVLLAEPLFTVPTLPLGVAGVLLLAASVVVGWIDGPEGGDQITAPGQVPSAPLRSRLAANLVLPLMTLLLLVLTWILHGIVT